MEAIKQKKVIFLILPALVLLVIVFVVKFTQKEDVIEDKNKMASLIELKAGDGRDSIKNLSDVYRKSNAEEQLKFEQSKRQSLTAEQIQDMIKKKNQSGNLNDVGFEETPIKSTDENKTIEVPKIRQKEEKVERKRYSSVSTAKETQKISETKQPNPSYESGGMGIAINTNRDASEKSPEVKSVKAQYYPAYLEEEVVVKQNKSVVFVLSKDAIIDGELIKKNSTLFGKATDMGSYFDIQIDVIKDVNGNTHNVNLIVYNEKFSRGIVHDSKLNEAAKEGGGEAMNDISSEVSSAAGNTGLGVASRTGSNIVRAVTRRDASISLYQGYKIYIKEVNR